MGHILPSSFLVSTVAFIGLWLKTQLTLYRNGREGKIPALSVDRIRMLEGLGVTWGERRRGIPWEERYEALMDFKVSYGHMAYEI